jgi:hypothetical protein
VLHASKERTMKYLRSLLFACVTAVALIVPMTGTSVAQANPPRHGHAPTYHGPTRTYHGPARTYWVYYRSRSDSSWVCYGGYDGADQAASAVRYYTSIGYEAYYR